MDVVQIIEIVTSTGLVGALVVVGYVALQFGRGMMSNNDEILASMRAMRTMTATQEDFYQRLIDENKTLYNEARAQIEMLNVRIATLESGIAKRDVEIKMLTDQISALRDETAALREDNQKKSDKIDALLVKQAEQQSELEQVSKERDALRGRLDALEAKRST